MRDYRDGGARDWGPPRSPVDIRPDPSARGIAQCTGNTAYAELAAAGSATPDRRIEQTAHAAWCATGQAPRSSASMWLGTGANAAAAAVASPMANTPGKTADVTAHSTVSTRTTLALID